MLQSRARQFFDEFVEAFRSFDGARIAERYAAPYLAFHGRGRSDVYLEHRDIAEYFQGVVDGYYAKGVRGCSYKDFEYVPVGGESALATVTWELHGEDGAVLVAWRESYTLWFDGDRFLVFASIDHAG